MSAADQSLSPLTLRRLAPWFLVTVLVGLRIWYVFHLRIDQDEWQHLHTIWSSIKGQLLYRDVFDNHMPLFHMFFRPLASWVGECSDVVQRMRLFMLPIFFGCLAIAYAMAAKFYGRRQALWTVVCLGLCPIFLFTGTEFRPDLLWCLFWMAALWSAVSGPLTVVRCFCSGVLMGLAVAVSLKSVLLLGGTLGGVMVCWAVDGWKINPRKYFSRGTACLAGLVLPPLVIALWFAGQGTFHDFWENVVGFNARYAEDPTPLKYARMLLFPPALLWIGFLAIRVYLRLEGPRELKLQRIFLCASGGVYLALLLSFWPILSNEDYLPAVSVLMPAVVAVLYNRPHRFHLPSLTSSATSVSLFALLELAITLAVRPPVLRSIPECLLLNQVLTITDEHDMVMDPTGQSIFRPRPCYNILETITRNCLKSGRLPDTIAQDMIRTHTRVAVASWQYPHDAQQFLDQNFLHLDGDLLVAGQVWHVEPNDSPRTIDFNVAIPAAYVLLYPHEAEGATEWASIDREPYNGAQSLQIGRHRLICRGQHAAIALMWAKASARGFKFLDLPPAP